MGWISEFTLMWRRGLKFKRILIWCPLALGISASNLGICSEKLQREGTQVVLSPEEVRDLRQWVENAKVELEALEDDTRRGNLEDRRRKIVREFEAIVSRSAKKENELLMRYALNRALEIDELVGSTPAPSELQSMVAFLDATMRLAKGFYADDQKYLEAIGRNETFQLQKPMTVFAYEYTEMILSFSRTFLRPEREYVVTYYALGWLGNDLNSSRNLDRIRYAEVITRISRIQSQFPSDPEGSVFEIQKMIRDLKWQYRERAVKQILEISEELRRHREEIERKRIEEERRRLAEIAERERLARLSEAERRREEEEKARMAQLDQELRQRLANLSPEDRSRALLRIAEIQEKRNRRITAAQWEPQGSCKDNHSEFRAAKEFAYSGNGLNKTDSGATAWALSFVSDYKCGSLTEFRRRFEALYDFAYSGNTLNHTDSSARSFALSNLMRINAAVVADWTRDYKKFYDFFYSGHFLNRTDSSARSSAWNWVQAENCEDIYSIKEIKDEYRKHYHFAYSGHGLNKTDSAARSYAIAKINHMTPCSM